MKTFVLAAVATLTWLSATVGYAQWPQATYDTRRWEWEAGARIMDRPGDETNINLVTDALTNQVLFTSDTATDLESSVGYDLRFLRKNCYGIEWEVRSFFNNWDINENVTSVNNIQSPFFDPIRTALPGTIGPVTVTGITFQSLNYNYESDLFNIELNAKKAVYPGVTLLVGPRFMYLEDRLTAITGATIQGNIGGVPQQIAFTQNTSVQTENPLFGVQVGADLNVPVSRYFYITGFIKAGGYGNTARATIVQANNLQGTTSRISARRSQGSFVGEVGGKVNMEVFPGIMSFYAGYEAMWLDNVAIAPTQLLSGGTTGTFGNVQMTGTPFVHGIVIGGTIRR